MLKSSTKADYPKPENFKISKMKPKFFIDNIEEYIKQGNRSVPTENEIKQLENKMRLELDIEQDI